MRTWEGIRKRAGRGRVGSFLSGRAREGEEGCGGGREEKGGLQVGDVECGRLAGGETIGRLEWGLCSGVFSHEKVVAWEL